MSNDTKADNITITLTRAAPSIQVVTSTCLQKITRNFLSLKYMLTSISSHHVPQMPILQKFYQAN